MLGIDTSKATLQCCLRDPLTQNVLWDLDVANSVSGVATLLKKAPVGVHWVIEPTGRYSVSVVRQAQDAGRTVLLAPPRKAKDYLRSLQSRAKTDKLDARGLALFGLSRPLTQYPVKEEALDTIDQLLSARKGLSNSITRLQLQSSELPHAKEVLDKAIAGLKAEIQDLDKLIASRAEIEPRMAVAKELRKVPGIGAVTSVAITSRLASKGFARPDQFVAYLGLDIDVHESGTRKGHRGLTHQGDAELRRLLYCCAQSSLRAKGSPFLAQYNRELAKGLPTTAALCAIARKMAKLCWALYTHKAKYDPDRIYTSPPRGRHAVSDTTGTDSAAASGSPSERLHAV